MIPPEGVPVGDEGAEPKDDVPAGEVGPEPPPEAFTEEEPEPAPTARPRTRLVACLLIGLIVLGPVLVVVVLQVGPHLVRAMARRAEWVPYAPDLPPHERWQVEMPGAPSASVRDSDGYAVTNVGLFSESGVGYGVNSMTFPPTVLPDASPERLLDEWEEFIESHAGDRAVIARGPATVDGRRGRYKDLRVMTPEATVHARLWLVVVGRSAFGFIVAPAGGDLDHPDVRRFIRSVKLPR